MPSDFGSFVAEETFLVATAESTLAGFAGLCTSKSEVDALFVDPSFLRRGLGRHLLSHLEELAVKAKLTVLTLKASLNSVGFYKSAGYIQGQDGWHTTKRGLQIACIHMAKAIGRAASNQGLQPTDQPRVSWGVE
jgi:GNAT superfamily N-acetyltransferase